VSFDARVGGAASTAAGGEDTTLEDGAASKVAAVAASVGAARVERSRDAGIANVLFPTDAD
jgi:hypothetical protein